MKKEDGLKEMYRFKETLWNLFLNRFFKILVSVLWGKSFMSYTCLIFIELGGAKYYYYKYSFRALFRYVVNYTDVMKSKVKGEYVEEDFDMLFTKEELFLRQINFEADEIDRKVNAWG